MDKRFENLLPETYEFGGIAKLELELPDIDELSAYASAESVACMTTFMCGPVTTSCTT
tara:strand:- start:9461 stop:9634 length:174 start_codon:yes stop_codon:yes gene_type:complete